MNLVIKYEIARGWKQIAKLMNCSVNTAKLFHRAHGLPLVREGDSFTLSIPDLEHWRNEQRKKNND